MSALVIDASVAIKLVLNESDSDLAHNLIGARPLAAPEFLLLECGNALWATARRKVISGEQAAAGLAKLAAPPKRILCIALSFAA